MLKTTSRAEKNGEFISEIFLTLIQAPCRVSVDSFREWEIDPRRERESSRVKCMYSQFWLLAVSVSIPRKKEREREKETARESERQRESLSLFLSLSLSLSVSLSFTLSLSLSLPPFIS